MLRHALSSLHCLQELGIRHRQRAGLPCASKLAFMQGVAARKEEEQKRRRGVGREGAWKGETDTNRETHTHTCIRPRPDCHFSARREKLQITMANGVIPHALQKCQRGSETSGKKRSEVVCLVSTAETCTDCLHDTCRHKVQCQKRWTSRSHSQLVPAREQMLLTPGPRRGFKSMTLAAIARFLKCFLKSRQAAAVGTTASCTALCGQDNCFYHSFAAAEER